jgi:type IV pilus assembly protein PilA
MQATLRSVRDKRAAGDRGFTLIELLVVVVIIGVLVAIAIPLYLNYRKGAENKSAASDLRGAISAVEQYYTENGNAYPAGPLSATGPDSMTFAGSTNEIATITTGNQLEYRYVAASTSYYICAHSNDGGAVYVYNSSSGGSVKKSSRTTLALCASNGD